jgi:Putative peptidoglycan binding domain
MILRKGDKGPAVMTLQRMLNKIGSLLLVDGDFGPATREAVADGRIALQRPGPPEADDVFQDLLTAFPEPFPLLGAPGVTFIGRAEIGTPRIYKEKYTHSVWPTAKSGITIGIGYDLQFVTAAQLRADWSMLRPAELDALEGVVGKPGSVDRLARVSWVAVPLLDAMNVFLKRSLPEYVNSTRSIYPEIDGLSAHQRTALVSLVFNRGARVHDTDPNKQERREMRRIQILLAEGRLEEIDEQFEEMTRLWPSTQGLVNRRRLEARLWRAGFSAVQVD